MSVYSDAVLVDTPALYWRLGESTGTNANDETVNNRDGTYVGTPTLAVAGALSRDADTAVELDGVDDALTSVYAPYVAGASLTLEQWVWRKTNATGDAIVGASGDGNVNLRLSAGTDTAQLNLRAASFATWAGSGVGTGVWKHVVLTFDNPADLAELFVNGVSLGALTPSGTPDWSATAANFQVGRRAASSEYADVKVDEVAVYESILSPARIAAHYAAGAAINRMLLGVGA